MQVAQSLAARATGGEGVVARAAVVQRPGFQEEAAFWRGMVGGISEVAVLLLCCGLN